MTIIELLKQIKPHQRFLNGTDLNKEGRYWIDDEGTFYYRAYEGERISTMPISKDKLLSDKWEIVE